MLGKPCKCGVLEAKDKRLQASSAKLRLGRKPCPAWVDELRDRSEQTIAVDEGRHKRAAQRIAFRHYLAFLGALTGIKLPVTTLR